MSLLWLVSLAWAGTVEVRVLQRGDAEPLPAARVTLADGTALTLDERARLTVDGPDGEPLTLRITSTDHEGQTLTVTPPLTKPVRVFLTPLDTPGEIVVESFAPTADLTVHTVDAEMAFETPGTYDDAVRLVQALPGVNVTREYAPSSGDVSVRGSLPGDNRYYYDGIEVPYLYHFNQYASVFPASDLSSLELYSSTFGARYGDSVGAIIEAESDPTAPEDVTGYATINFVTAGAGLKVPLKKGWWIGVSGRRSFQDLVEGVTDQYTLFPRFYDFHARAEHVTPTGGTSIFASGAGDRYDRFVGEIDVLDPVEDAAAPTLTYGRDYQLVGVKHRWKLGRIVTSVLHDHLRASLNAPGRQDQRTLSLPTRLDLAANALDGKLRWEAGAELRPSIMWLDLQDAGRAGSLVTTEAPAMAWGANTDTRLLRLRADAYATLHAQLGPVRLIPGLRVGLDSAGWTPTVEPRLAARFKVADQTELTVAGGRYQQRPENTAIAADLGLPTTSAWQVGLGLDQTIAGRLEINVDGYAKFLTDLAVQPPEGAPIVFDRGESYGGELTLRYRMRETFFAWAWFAYGRSFARSNDGTVVPTAADQPYSGGLVVSWNIKPPLNVAIRYKIASGLPYTGIFGSTYDAAEDTWLPRFGDLNGERFPLYQKIDLHTAYQFTFNRWAFSLALDVLIVPKSSAQLYPTWNYDYTETGYVLGPQVLPLLTGRATF